MTDSYRQFDPDHVHGRDCDGVGIVIWRDDQGNDHTWLCGASSCPLRPDSEETMRSHFHHFFPGKQFISAVVVPYHSAEAAHTLDNVAYTEHTQRVTGK